MDNIASLLSKDCQFNPHGIPTLSGSNQIDNTYGLYLKYFAFCAGFYQEGVKFNKQKSSKLLILSKASRVDLFALQK